MKFISIDLELDQPSNEIFQIGASVWDTDHPDKAVDGFNEFIRLDVNWTHTLNIGISLGELIPYGQSVLDTHGKHPTHVWASFVHWLNTHNLRRIVQWGNGDWRLMTEQTVIPIPNLRNYNVFNLKSTFKNLLQPALRLPRTGHLQAVVKNMNMKFIGDPHNAYDDAYNTGRLLVKYHQILDQYRQINKILQY